MASHMDSALWLHGAVGVFRHVIFLGVLPRVSSPSGEVLGELTQDSRPHVTGGGVVDGSVQYLLIMIPLPE